MSTNVASAGLDALIADLIAPQIAGLQERISELAGDVMEAGLRASEAEARAAGLERAVRGACEAAGLAYAAPSFTGPAAARVQRRRRRTDQGGLRLVRGTAS